MEKELGSDFKYFVFQAFFAAQHSSYRNFIGPYFIDSLDSVPSADVYYKSTTSRLRTAKKNLQDCCKNLKLGKYPTALAKMSHRRINASASA